MDVGSMTLYGTASPASTVAETERNTKRLWRYASLIDSRLDAVEELVT